MTRNVRVERAPRTSVLSEWTLWKEWNVQGMTVLNGFMPIRRLCFHS